jgi:uncharacterized membrane protein
MIKHIIIIIIVTIIIIIIIIIIIYYSVLKAGHIPHKHDGAEISYSQQHRNQAVLHSLYRYVYR